MGEVEGYPNFIGGVTADCPNYWGGGAEPGNIANNSGMNDQGVGLGDPAALDLAIVGDCIWHTTANPDPDPVVTFDLGGTYPLANIVIWNENQAYEGPGARGIKECTIAVSTDGVGYTPLPETNGDDEGNYTLNPCPTDTGPFAATDNLALAGVTASHVQLTAHSSHGSPYWGLSEVRFYQVPEPSMLALLALGGLALVTPKRK